MEIQAQTVLTPSTGASNASNGTAANGAAGAAAVLPGQSNTDFSATLNGMLTGVPEGNQVSPPLSLTGLNVLAQLMAALKEDAALTEEQNTQDLLKQLDELIKLLDTNAGDAANLLENPDVQAWLSQLQDLLQLQTLPAANTAPIQNGPASGDGIETVQLTQMNEAVDTNNLNPLLFVPLEATSKEGEDEQAATLAGQQGGTDSEVEKLPDDVNRLLQSNQDPNTLLIDSKGKTSADSNPDQKAPGTGLQHVTVKEAKKLLEQFIHLLQDNRDQNSAPLVEHSAQKLAADLQKVIAPLLSAQKAADSTKDPVLDSEAAGQLLRASSADRISAALLQTGGNKTENTAPIQVNVTPVSPKLEYLAAKTLPPMLAVENVVHEAPLFEPLQENIIDMTADNNAMPMHEFLKQVQAGDQIAKTPVLIMHAPTFAEDMTQFVVKSFTLDAKAEGITEAKLSLYPQHLGHVDVKLTIHHGQLVAQFIAESSLGKEMLESQLSQLKTTLQNQGIQVDKLEVTQSQSFQSGLFQEQRQQHSQQSGKQEKGSGTNRILSLDEEIAKETVRTSSSTAARPGQSSIDTTA